MISIKINTIINTSNPPTKNRYILIAISLPYLSYNIHLTADRTATIDQQFYPGAKIEPQKE
jgi:hypothetical protein